MHRALVRAATVLAAALVATAVAAGSAAASVLPITQRFSVPSGDSCTYGYTEGTLEWPSPVPVSTVSVTGIIVDRPNPSEPISTCRDDGYYTLATYVAYARERPVAESARRVDNGVQRFQFVLATSATVLAIDRVVIQVCRVSLTGTSPTPDYCGRQHSFTPPAIGPASS